MLSGAALGRRVAELWTKKPGAILRRVPFHGAADKWSFLSQGQLSAQADSYGVRTAPVCSRMHRLWYIAYVRALRIPNAGSHAIVWTHTHTHTHTRARARMHIHTHTSTHARTHARRHTHARIHTLTRMHTHIGAHACTHARAHAQTHTHPHTHTTTNTHTNNPPPHTHTHKTHTHARVRARAHARTHIRHTLTGMDSATLMATVALPRQGEPNFLR